MMVSLISLICLSKVWYMFSHIAFCLFAGDGYNLPIELIGVDPIKFKVGDEAIVDGEIVTVVKVHIDRPPQEYYTILKRDGKKFFAISYPNIVGVECDSSIYC